MDGARSGVRLAELVASLSLATDLLMGQPMEHAMRSCLLGLELGERLGLGADDRAEVYWVSLLAWIGCTADPHELTENFGDDIEVFGSAYDVDLAGLDMLRFLARRAGAGRPPIDRARKLLWLATSVSGWAKESFSGKCEIAEDLSSRLGMESRIRDRLQEVFERYDGGGMPAGLKGDAISASVRVFHLAEIVEVHYRVHGVEGAVEVATRRRGTQFDPAIVDEFLKDAAGLCQRFDEGSAWDAIVSQEPEPHRVLSEAELDSALEAVADLVGLKSPFMAEHSRGVAVLAEDAARRLQIGEADAVGLRRAALVHDLGRMGVSNAIWEKPGRLSDGERERVRMHPYFTERMLARSSLAPVGALAALHHERCDGSGYYKGSDGTALSVPARLLAVADAYHAMLEPRPHREQLSPDAAAAAIRDDVREGRFDGRCADAVLEAAGHARPKRLQWPAGLSDREVEVLRLIARGHSKKDVGKLLHISPSTADHHVRHIYTKTGVGTRAGATLFAMRHGLLDSLTSD